jgi:hypothetical protein
MDIQPVVLEGQHVRLEPLTLHHAEAFCEAAGEWNLTPETVREGIESALRQQAGGVTLLSPRSSGRRGGSSAERGFYRLVRHSGRGSRFDSAVSNRT